MRKKINKRTKRIKIGKTVSKTIIAIAFIFLFGAIGTCDYYPMRDIPWKQFFISMVIIILCSGVIVKLDDYERELQDYKEKYFF